MENNLSIWDVRKNQLHDTETNFNYVDLNEPYETWASGVYPQLRHQGPAVTDPVKYFRHTLLWTQYSNLLNYLTMGRMGRYGLVGPSPSLISLKRWISFSNIMLQRNQSRSTLNEKNRLSMVSLSDHRSFFMASTGG